MGLQDTSLNICFQHWLSLHSFIELTAFSHRYVNCVTTFASVAFHSKNSDETSWKSSCPHSNLADRKWITPVSLCRHTNRDVCASSSQSSDSECKASIRIQSDYQILIVIYSVNLKSIKTDLTLTWSNHRDDMYICHQGLEFIYLTLFCWFSIMTHQYSTILLDVLFCFALF